MVTSAENNAASRAEQTVPHQQFPFGALGLRK